MQQPIDSTHPNHTTSTQANLRSLGSQPPARKIPKNAMSVTGVLTCTKPDHLPQAFESTLERDLLILLDSDPGVRAFRTQPVQIAYTHPDGSQRTYTPDALVEFQANPATGEVLRPLLVEVKPRKILFKDWEALKPKFMAARAYAKERGWTFRILTEQEIRPKTFLPNLKWLRQYLRHQPDPVWAFAFLEGMRGRTECTVAALLDQVCSDKSRHSEIVPHLWNLIATRQIWVDLRAPLLMTSVLRHALRPDPDFLWGAGGPPLRTRRVAAPDRVTRFLPMAPPLMSLANGSRVMVRGSAAVILKPVNFREVLVRFEASGIRERVPIADLQPYVPATFKPRFVPDLAALDEEEMKEALRRTTVIQTLAGVRRTKAQVAGAAQCLGVSVVTAYRWLNQFVDAGERMTALVPNKPNGGRGKSRIADERTDAVIQEVIDTFYFKSRKPNGAATIAEVRRRCREQKVPLPAHNTVRKRISWLDPELVMRRREGAKAANQAFRSVRGSFPGADYPYAVAQIDHGLCDVFLVDPISRKPIGRAWLTVMIDVYSRMVLGWYTSLEGPGNGSLGGCLRSAALLKDAWLKAHGVDAEWPCWGFPETIHADNAKEFRGDMFKRLGYDYHFSLEWRPLGKPQYGAHIERFMGTMAKAIRLLPGTTFSNIRERGAYDSAKHAVMTFDEFERWVSQEILGNYHNKAHAGLGGDTPLERFRKGIEGTEGAPPRGLPPVVPDSDRFRFDCMPFVERTVQPHGLEIDELFYFSDVLKCYLHAKDPDTAKLKRKFLVRRDPSDISRVYFLDPDSGEYHEIPTRNTGHPTGVALWEWKMSKVAEKPGETQERNEVLRFKAVEAQRQIEAEAAVHSKKARRNQERRSQADRKAGSRPSSPKKPANAPQRLNPVSALAPAASDSLVSSFDEIE